MTDTFASMTRRMWTPDALAFRVRRFDRLMWDLRVRSTSTGARAVETLDRAIVAALGANGRKAAQTLTGEIFARLYSGDVEELGAPAPWASMVHNALGESSDFQRLAESVNGDPDLAAVATIKVVDAFADTIAKLVDADAEGEDVDAFEIQRAARSAAAEAGDAAEATRVALAGVLPGSKRGELDPSALDRMALAEHLANDDRMAKVMRLAGRLRRIAEREAEERDPAGRSEVVGITRGADVERLLPVELAYLADEDLEALALARIAERAALQYRLEGRQPMGRGPLVVLVDESASMVWGEADTWARAVVIAAISQGRRERRDVHVVYFDHDLRGRAHMAASGDVTSDYGVRSVDALITDAVTRGSGGGTDFRPPVEAALEILENGAPRADLVMVTDGMAALGDDLLNRVAAVRDTGARIYGLTVNGGALSPAVEALCDFAINLDQEQDVEALAAAVPVRRS